MGAKEHTFYTNVETEHRRRKRKTALTTADAEYKITHGRPARRVPRVPSAAASLFATIDNH